MEGHYKIIILINKKISISHDNNTCIMQQLLIKLLHELLVNFPFFVPLVSCVYFALWRIVEPLLLKLFVVCLWVWLLEITFAVVGQSSRKCVTSEQNMEVATYIGMYVCITVCLKAFLSQACRPTCSYVYGYTNVHTYVCMKIYVECSMK